MDFAFRAHEPIAAGLRRIARAEVDAALADVSDPEQRGMAESVHDLRKRCKQLRAVARLVRPAVGDDAYAPTNAAFRDAARQLSAVRDTQVLVEVLDDLVDDVQDDDALDRASTAAGDVDRVRRTLASRHAAVTESLAADRAPLTRARALLEVGWRHVEGWPVDDDAGFDALAGGLALTYGRARRAARECRRDPSTEQLHEWRKRTKYHWHHLQLLRPAAPALLEPWADRVHDLSDVLGADHDLAVLASTLRADPLAHGGESVVAGLCELVRTRRAELQDQACALGDRVTAEHPDALVDRLRLWWEAWRREGAAGPTA